MSFFVLFLIGILVGTAMITPGVSGGVVAVLFGIYDKIIYYLTNIFKDFKKSFIFLSILSLGVLVGAVWFSNIIVFLFNKHEIITKFSFIGLILGSIPYLFKKIKKVGKVNYKALVITFILSFLLLVLSNKFTKFNINIYGALNITYIVKLFVAGFIYSIGKIIPGISGSFLLMLIGMYDFVLNVMAHPISVGLLVIDKLIFFILGLITGIIIFLKVINFLLDKHYEFTFSIIIGFVIGSIFSLIPLNLDLVSITKGSVTLIGCFVFSYKLTK